MEHVTLITGASTGMGFALAEEFARHHHDLVLVGKDGGALSSAKKRLVDSYGVKVETIEIDLRDGNSAENIYSFCREHKINVEVLVNNASGGTFGPFKNSSAVDNETNVQLDIVTPLDLTYLFLHDMNEKHHGYIMNVSSTAAFQPGPNLAVFYASKSFVLSFTEAMAVEEEKSGVIISCFCPGPIRTEFLEESGMDKSKIVKKFKPIDPQKAANEAYKALMKGKVVVIPGFKNKRRAFDVRILSRKCVRHLMKNITSPIVDEK